MKEVVMTRFQWSAGRLVAVVLVASIASAGCAKQSASKVYAGPGIPLDSPTADYPRGLPLDGFDFCYPFSYGEFQSTPFTQAPVERGPGSCRWLAEGLTATITDEVGAALAESSMPMSSGLGEAAGKRALEVSRAAIELRNAAPLYTYGQDPAVLASIDKAGHSAAQVMTAVSRNLDSAQALVGDRDFRNGLLLTQHLDGSGAAALLDRATARTAATAADAKENAEIARDLFVDLAQDPYGWREEIPKGSAISDTIAKTAAEHIDAFSTSGPGSEVRPAAEIADGFLSKLELDGRYARDLLTFVAAGREPGSPDKDLIALHTAAKAYTRDQVMHAIEGALDPSTALILAGTAVNAVKSADFRSAMHAYESVDTAWSAVYDDVSAVARIPLCRDVEFAAGAAPCWVGDALSAAVDEAMAGFEPVATAGSERQRTLDDIVRPAGPRHQPPDRQRLSAGWGASHRHPRSRCGHRRDRTGGGPRLLP
jgi:hypothetical protein